LSESRAESANSSVMCFYCALHMLQKRRTYSIDREVERTGEGVDSYWSVKMSGEGLCCVDRKGRNRARRAWGEDDVGRDLITVSAPPHHSNDNTGRRRINFEMDRKERAVSHRGHSGSHRPHRDLGSSGFKSAGATGEWWNIAALNTVSTYRCQHQWRRSIHEMAVCRG
jgi:hypothetical protein